MTGRQPDIVPPGNAVLGKHDRRVVPQQRPQAGGESTDPGRLQRADDDILRTQRRRVVRCVHPGREFSVADTKLQAFCPGSFQMRPAHHAGDLMSRQREPHRKMAADGARAVNADTHGDWVPVGDETTDGSVSTSWPRSATGHETFYL